MDLKLRKVPNHELYWVLRNGRKVSTKPVNREEARAIWSSIRERTARMSARRMRGMSGGRISPFGATLIAATTVGALGYTVGRETDVAPLESLRGAYAEANRQRRAAIKAYNEYTPKEGGYVDRASKFFARTGAALQSQYSALKSALVLARTPAEKVTVEARLAEIASRLTDVEEGFKSLRRNPSERGAARAVERVLEEGGGSAGAAAADLSDIVGIDEGAAERLASAEAGGDFLERGASAARSDYARVIEARARAAAEASEALVLAEAAAGISSSGDIKEAADIVAAAAQLRAEEARREAAVASKAQTLEGTYREALREFNERVTPEDATALEARLKTFDTTVQDKSKLDQEQLLLNSSMVKGLKVPFWAVHLITIHDNRFTSFQAFDFTKTERDEKTRYSGEDVDRYNNSVMTQASLRKRFNALTNRTVIRGISKETIDLVASMYVNLLAYCTEKYPNPDLSGGYSQAAIDFGHVALGASVAVAAGVGAFAVGRNIRDRDRAGCDGKAPRGHLRRGDSALSAIDS